MGVSQQESPALCTNPVDLPTVPTTNRTQPMPSPTTVRTTRDTCQQAPTPPPSSAGKRPAARNKVGNGAHWCLWISRRVQSSECIIRAIRTNRYDQYADTPRRRKKAACARFADINRGLLVVLSALQKSRMEKWGSAEPASNLRAPESSSRGRRNQRSRWAAPRGSTRGRQARGPP